MTMDKYTHIPIYGQVPSLATVNISIPDSPPDLLVQSIVPYRRFAVRVADDGMDTFGLREGTYAVFREQRYPTHDCSVCLVTFGDEVTIRMLEYIHNSEVTLRVAGEKIPPLELAPTDFQVIGVLDGVILEEFARVVQPEPVLDWGS